MKMMALPDMVYFIYPRTDNMSIQNMFLFFSLTIIWSDFYSNRLDETIPTYVHSIRISGEITKVKHSLVEQV